MRTALHWRAVMDGEHPSDEERAAFQSWFDADLAHRAAYEDARRFWSGLAALKEAPLDSLRAPEAQAPLPGRMSRVLSTCRITRHRLAAVASLTAAAAVVVVWLALLPAGEPVPATYATATGEVETVTLEDGSLVTLGARSTIEVVMDKSLRSVELIGGDAYFAVTADPRPFEVLSGRVSARALGTEFAIRTTGTETQVAVAEGLVGVRHSGAGASTDREYCRLERGQRIVSSGKAGLGDVVAVDPEKVGAWRRHRLVYEEEPLTSLIGDLNRYREKPVALVDSQLAVQTITATFDARDTNLVLQTLTELFPLEVVEEPQQTTLRRRP